MYNIFVETNVFASPAFEETLSKFLQLIGQPTRIQILLVIAEEPACVCHLEAILKARQASISQHLMALRKAGLVETRRDGRNIFYALAQPGILDVVRQAAHVAGISGEALAALAVRPVPDCPCPQCNPGADPEFTCQKLHPAG